MSFINIHVQLTYTIRNKNKNFTMNRTVISNIKFVIFFQNNIIETNLHILKIYIIYRSIC